MAEQDGNIHTLRHRSDTSLLRVASVQLARLDPEDRAALLPFVKRDMEAAR